MDVQFLCQVILRRPKKVQVTVVAVVYGQSMSLVHGVTAFSAYSNPQTKSDLYYSEFEHQKSLIPPNMMARPKNLEDFPGEATDNAVWIKWIIYIYIGPTISSEKKKKKKHIQQLHYQPILPNPVDSLIIPNYL